VCVWVGRWAGGCACACVGGVGDVGGCACACVCMHACSCSLSFDVSGERSACRVCRGGSRSAGGGGAEELAASPATHLSSTLDNMMLSE
jgi:hypothetical protein